MFNLYKIKLRCYPAKKLFIVYSKSQPDLYIFNFLVRSILTEVKKIGAVWKHGEHDTERITPRLLGSRGIKWVGHGTDNPGLDFH